METRNLSLLLESTSLWFNEWMIKPEINLFYCLYNLACLVIGWFIELLLLGCQYYLEWVQYFTNDENIKWKVMGTMLWTIIFMIFYKMNK